MSAEHHEINEETMKEEIRKFIDNMTDEQKELARKCKTPEEFLKLAEGGMIELSDEQLDMVAGGADELWGIPISCSTLGSDEALMI